MRTLPNQLGQPVLPDGRILTLASPEFSPGPHMSWCDVNAPAGAWHAANDPFGIPFALPRGGVVNQIGWHNGSAAGGGIDVGIYSLSWVRLVSSGSVTGSGNSLWQWANVTDTALPRGRYYLVMVRDNTTANRQAFYGTPNVAAYTAFLGGQTSTTDSFPLPDPLVGMTASALTLPPLMAIAFRTPFA